MARYVDLLKVDSAIGYLLKSRIAVELLSFTSLYLLALVARPIGAPIFLATRAFGVMLLIGLIHQRICVGN